MFVWCIYIDLFFLENIINFYDDNDVFYLILMIWIILGFVFGFVLIICFIGVVRKFWYGL